MLIDILEPMGAQFDRLRCEVCQNLFLSPMNTGFLRHAVATVLTVYGIETSSRFLWRFVSNCRLQQCLPFTVLKPVTQFDIFKWHKSCNSAYRLRY